MLEHRDVFLWNPATKEVRVLPQLSLVYQPREPENTYLAINNIALGFGLDETTNDFKVVRFFYSSTKSTNRSVVVYSLRSDSWSIVDPVLPFDSIISDPKAPYRNGTYCWLVRGQRSASPRPDNFILTFDFSNELFGTMQLPDVQC
ncbi:hypothetical protein IFM89_003204 [Coptis chinensis]|uniref:F-box associated beta-propeller type 1 domain-containing protein n=1 Tax=Coptis chinensis TaxID=261450 RepID=A0A835H623_9MAGN|nr:hypothetical protein IFM89_003204 [Coptis chinensis]